MADVITTNCRPYGNICDGQAMAYNEGSEREVAVKFVERPAERPRIPDHEALTSFKPVSNLSPQISYYCFGQSDMNKHNEPVPRLGYCHC